MDIGTHTTTGFDYNGDVMQFIMTNPGLMDCVQGMLHSHNTMSSFFSGTDMSELADNSKNHNYYLSVVVNNAMDIVAKIGIYNTCKSVVTGTKSWRNIFGQTKTSEYSYEKEEDILEYYDCKVEAEIFNVPQWFEDRVKIIDAPKTTSTPQIGFKQPTFFSNKDSYVDFIPKFIMRDLKYEGFVYDAMKKLESEIKDEESDVLVQEYIESFDLLVDNYFTTSEPNEITLVNKLQSQIDNYRNSFPMAHTILQAVIDELFEVEDDAFDLSNPNNTGFYGK